MLQVTVISCRCWVSIAGRGQIYKKVSSYHALHLTRWNIPRFTSAVLFWLKMVHILTGWGPCSQTFWLPADVHRPGQVSYNETLSLPDWSMVLSVFQLQKIWARESQIATWQCSFSGLPLYIMPAAFVSIHLHCCINLDWEHGYCRSIHSIS